MLIQHRVGERVSWSSLLRRESRPDSASPRELHYEMKEEFGT